MATKSFSTSLEKYKIIITLQDSSTIHIRPIQRDDEEKMLALFRRFSPRTIYLRFHGFISEMPRERVKRFCTIDYDNSFALVATVGEGIEKIIIAVCRYYRLPKKDTAELAIVVEDAYQDKGIGTHLLKQLVTIARENGIRIFEGYVLAENQKMIQMLKDSGFQESGELEQGVYQAVIHI